MKKRKIDQAASRPAASDSLRKSALFWVLALCLLVVGSIVVSMLLLGDRLGRFSVEEVNVIALVPPKESQSGIDDGAGSIRAAENRDLGGTVSPRLSAASNDTGSQLDRSQGGLAVSDDTQTWDSETHVNLFRSSYGSSVKSDDGEKIIAPGTTSRYAFSVKNEGSLPLNYAISLEVKILSSEEEGSELPLEWRLLAGDDTIVSDWQVYNGRTATLKESALNVRNQDNYTFEWRWLYEQDEDMDETDTMLGNLAVDQALSAEATILVHAEQNTEQNAEQNEEQSTEQTGPSGRQMWVQTGDTNNLILYLVLMTVSGCGLVILIQCARRRKKRE